MTDVDQSLVLGQDLKELESHITEWGGIFECLVQLNDFLGSHTLVLGEESEALAVGEELLKILDVLVHVVELS